MNSNTLSYVTGHHEASIGPAAVLAATSSDGGRSWEHSRVVSSAPGGVDRVSITADPFRRGVAYIVWQSTQGTFFSKTKDHGRGWSPPVVIVPAQLGTSGTNGNQILVDRRTGVLYDIFDHWQVSPHPRRICGRVGSSSRCHSFPVPYDVMFIRSSDGGTTWSFPQGIAQDLSVGWVVPSAAGKVRTGANLPGAAIDPVTGTLYVVWQDARRTVGEVDDILIVSSSDHGLHWSHPLRVNMPGKASAVLSSVAVNDRSDVGVGYYQIREAKTGTAALPTDYWFRASSDRGRTFHAPKHVGGPFNLATAPRSSALFVGDYEGLVAIGHKFQPFFVMTKSGQQKNRTDVYTRSVSP